MDHTSTSTSTSTASFTAVDDTVCNDSDNGNVLDAAGAWTPAHCGSSERPGPSSFTGSCYTFSAPSILWSSFYFAPVCGCCSSPWDQVHSWDDIGESSQQPHHKLLRAQRREAGRVRDTRQRQEQRRSIPFKWEDPAKPCTGPEEVVPKDELRGQRRWGRDKGKENTARRTVGLGRCWCFWCSDRRAHARAQVKKENQWMNTRMEKGLDFKVAARGGRKRRTMQYMYTGSRWVENQKRTPKGFGGPFPRWADWEWNVEQHNASTLRGDYCDCGHHESLTEDEDEDENKNYTVSILDLIRPVKKKPRSPFSRKQSCSFKRRDQRCSSLFVVSGLSLTSRGSTPSVGSTASWDAVSVEDSMDDDFLDQESSDGSDWDVCDL